MDGCNIALVLSLYAQRTHIVVSCVLQLPLNSVYASL